MIARPALSCLLLAAALAAPAAAETELARHGAAIGRAVASLPAGGTGALMFYDPVADLAGALEGARYAPADRAWVEAALAVYDLYRQLGGDRPSQRQLFRAGADGWSVGLEGRDLRTFGAPDAALVHYFRLLAGASRSLPTAIQEALPAAGGSLVQVVELLARRARDLVVARRGEAVSIAFPGADVAVGAAGLHVRSGRGPAGLVATVTPSASAVPGRLAVHAFRSGQRFTPVDRAEVTVTDGSASLSATAADPSIAAPDAPPAPLVDRAAGEIRRMGSVETYRIAISQVGIYRLASEGPSDVAASLEAADGKVLARDDDGGSGYNFALERTLAPGEYLLKVRHCCSGTGPFSVTLKRAR